MSQSTTLILLPQTVYVNPGNGAPYTVTGETQPAAAYYLGNNDLQTVAAKLTNVTGNLVIEATLATAPTNDDWFSVYEVIANNSDPADSPSKIASSASLYTNITGNFVYMRAKIKDFTNGGVS